MTKELTDELMVELRKELKEHKFDLECSLSLARSRRANKIVIESITQSIDTLWDAINELES